MIYRENLDKKEMEVLLLYAINDKIYPIKHNGMMRKNPCIRYRTIHGFYISFIS